MSSISIERINIGRVWRAGRMLAGKTQAQLANELAIPQSSISKYENLRLEPSASDWFRFCQHIGIDAHLTLNQGYIDGRQNFKEKLYSNALLKMPIKYRRDYSLKIREILPFREYLIATLGNQEWEEFIEMVGINDEMFYILDYQVSFTLLLDLFSWAHSKGISLSSDIFKKPMNLKFHGALSTELSRKKCPLELFKALTDNQPLYQRVLDQKMSIQPDSAVLNFTLKDRALEYYNRSSLEEFWNYKVKNFSELSKNLFGSSHDIYIDMKNDSLDLILKTG